MKTIKLEDLGIEISEEKVLECAAELIARNAMSDVGRGLYEEPADVLGDVSDTGHFRERLEKRVNEKIDEAIDNVAAKHVLPNIEEFIEGYCLQKTNEWGEAKGEPKTFTEYLVERTTQWIGEEVDHEGKAKNSRDSYHWRSKSTRMAFYVDKHLHFHMQRAMEAVVKSALPTLEKGLNEALAGNIKKALEQIRVAVGTKA